MNREKLLKQLEAETAKIWRRMGEKFPECLAHNPPRIRLDGRYRKVLGFCDSENNTITLALYFFAKNHDTMLREVLPHEIAHQVDYHITGWTEYDIDEGHGPNWQKIMLEYGLEPTRTIGIIW